MTGMDKKPSSDTDEGQILDVDAYICSSFARAEGDRLWPKVWLQAGRVEELPDAGSYITYDVLDDSLLIVRDPSGRIRAYHNVCTHRGRRLFTRLGDQHDARGRARQFRCNFHGWCWNTEGENVYVHEAEDWGTDLNRQSLRLAEVKCDIWGGWIWISMDPDIEPLLDYLAPIPEMLDPFQLHRMRYKWRRWGVFDCNWKVALEAFIEGYHVNATHPEFNRFGSYRSEVKTYGRHSTRGYAVKGGDGNRGKLRLGSGGDPRINTAEMVAYTMKHVDTNFTQTHLAAALRLAQELPEGTPAPDVLRHWLDSARADDAARGVHWPVVTREQIDRAGNTWQVFPNFKIGHAVSNALCYSARPYGTDPDKCIFEAVTLELYPQGAEPGAQWEHLPVDDPKWGGVLAQDFSNLSAVQQGMKSRGFRGARPNPVQEGAITNLHRNLARYLGTQGPRPVK
jgi:phenylpropionate dioxygenase-like ring-hydroxylating dioxygenase large terminal subunit